MNDSLLFDTEEERVATERVLAAFKVKNINRDTDNLIADILRYAKEIDNLLSENNFTSRYLDRVSSLSENASIELDSDLVSLDFRVKEVIEDLIKRINTRVDLINNNNINLKSIEESYNINDIDLDKEIHLAKLTVEDFI